MIIRAVKSAVLWAGEVNTELPHPGGWQKLEVDDVAICLTYRSKCQIRSCRLSSTAVLCSGTGVEELSGTID